MDSFKIPLSLFILVTLSTLPCPVCSTSRGSLDQPNTVYSGFRITLSHVESGKNLTKLERIERRVRRGRTRLQRLNAMVLVSPDADQATSLDVEAPVVPGNGEFVMNLAIGTPPSSFSAIMDTGSDLIWTQCKPCTQCFAQSTPIFDPKKSSSFAKSSCTSSICEALPQSSCHDGCEYLYSYGDYSSTQGVLATETFTFGKVSVPNIAFGCGEDNEGDGFAQGAGLVGLGRGPLSLVSQMKEPKFSYCLTSIDDSKKSTLFMGSLESVNSTSGAIESTTKLIKNPHQPSFYYLALQGISVGGTKLPIKSSTFDLQNDGNGGMIIDSGTTITYLEESAFDLVKKQFASLIDLPIDNSGSTGLDLCFTLPSGKTSVEVPTLVFHFDGADLELPAENYMIADSSMGVACLAMGGSSGLSIFGNVQQQNILVTYDMDKDTMSFLPTQCDEL